MTPLTLGVTLEPRNEEVVGAAVAEPYLVLYVHAGLDVLVAIPVQPRRSKGRTYFVGYSRFSLEEIKRQLDPECGQLTVCRFVPRTMAMLSDEDLDRRFRRGAEDPCFAIRVVKLRWTTIRPMVEGEHLELFDADMLRAAVRARVQSLIVDPDFLQAYFGDDPLPSSHRLLLRLEDEVRQRLYQFWAGGSLKGALAPFTDRCGGLGKPKQNITKKLGRPNAKTRDGEVGYEGVIVYPNSQDEKIIRHCYEHFVVRGTDEVRAYRRMRHEFYADSVQTSSGTVERRLWPAHLTPSMAQFTRVGAQNDPAKAAWRKMLPSPKFENKFRAILGSVKSDVFAPGQRGFMDSSPYDLEMVSAISRLRRIGGANQILIADASFGYIPGFYFGLASANTRNVKLSYYISTVPGEMWEIIEHLGIDDRMKPEDWIPMRFHTIFCDNTDARTDDVMESFAAIGTYLCYVPTLQPAKNAMAEGSHHKVHRLGSHQLRGSTRGVRKERSEEAAADLACHNLKEGLRDFILAVHLHNTMELDIHVPLKYREMGIPPTRVALTRARMEETMSQRPTDIDLARYRLLPRYKGTFCADGVRLHKPQAGDKVEFLHPLVYVGSHPFVARLIEEARRGTRRDHEFFQREFAVHPFKLSCIWFIATDSPNGFELIQLDLAMDRIQDPELVERCTVDDVADLCVENQRVRPDLHTARDQKMAAHEADQREGDRHAMLERDRELKAAGHIPKKALRANKAENRKDEQKTLVEGVPVLIGGARNAGLSPSDAVRESPRSGKGVAVDTSTIALDRAQSQSDADDSLARVTAPVGLLRSAATQAAHGDEHEDY